MSAVPLDMLVDAIVDASSLITRDFCGSGLAAHADNPTVFESVEDWGRLFSRTS